MERPRVARAGYFLASSRLIPDQVIARNAVAITRVMNVAMGMIIDTIDGAS